MLLCEAEEIQARNLANAIYSLVHVFLFQNENVDRAEMSRSTENKSVNNKQAIVTPTVCLHTP